ncbi:hypothetical protein [Nocardia miyunensis]|uniref:hypothetical protein n=1 Tax=Nocardia miyunensis TaxID=282684 RepID=UPI00083523EF|nr:hypothetical protein [Nocardia miyunensis]
MTAPITTLDCAGLWRRTLLTAPGVTDTTTDVRWLQGLSRFVDLRRPASRPDFTGVRCAAEVQDLPTAHRDWLAAVDGFAGTLVRDGDLFHWGRDIGLQPAGPFPDEGRMRLAGAVIVETGVHADYVEHWEHEPAEPDSARWALELSGPDARALLVRVGDRFGWAARVGAGVELSLGTVTESHWTITDSAIPWREGCELTPTATDSATVHTHDIGPDGRPVRRAWTVTDTEGKPQL